jgi:hypothetical protein
MRPIGGIWQTGWTAMLAINLATGLMSSPASAQVAFQPPNCEFRAVFLFAPDITTATMNDENGNPQRETIASLNPIIDGKPNFFRAECMVVPVPRAIEEKTLLEDMQTIASGNRLKKAVAWIEKNPSGEMVGHVRGEITDSAATYVLDIRRYLGSQSILDVWVGSPPDIFPSQGNLIFLKELRRNGLPLN